MPFYIAFFVGFVVGIYGSIKNWGIVKTILITSSLTTALSLLFMSQSKAGEPYVKLRQTTVHLSAGSGFILRSDTENNYLITNWHVCNAVSWYNKVFASFEGGKLIGGDITKRDPISDLCAIKVSPGLSSLRLASTLKPGQVLYTRGYPLGVLSESSGIFKSRQTWSYTYPIDEVGSCFQGSKSVKNGNGLTKGCSVNYTDNLTSMYSRPGSSGSPVVNENGELVGVMSSWDGDKDLGGMVTLESVQSFIKGL
jgi:S1-C subfamily serine protease